MQETVKLISSSEFRKNQINSLPNIGDVKFDENGIVEVPQSQAQLLVEIISDLSFFEEEKVEKVETPLKPQTEDEDLNKSDDKDSLSPQVEQNDFTGSNTELVNTDGSVAQEEESNEDARQPTVEEIQSALEAKSAGELREMISKIDPSVNVKNKNEAIQYLVANLS